MRSPRKKPQKLAVGVFLLFFVSLGTTASAREQYRNTMINPTLKSDARRISKTDFEHESTDLIANFLYRRPTSLYYKMAPSGANGVNASWEQNQTDRWYIDQQRTGEAAIISGLVKHNDQAIAAGFKMFDWGFARQGADGSFPGTGYAFHSTSLFVQAVAHALLVIQQSPDANKYRDRVAHYLPLVHRAARWMIQPEVWQRGIKYNEPYTHRRYFVATALGLTGKLTGDHQLMSYARQSLKEGLELQRSDGVNPEKGGHDTSYQMVGVIYAARWVTYFPDDPLTPRVIEMIDKAVTWEASRISPAGDISSEGNTRTGGQELTQSGQRKDINRWQVIRGFAYWASITGNLKWEAIARRIAINIQSHETNR